MEIIDWIDSKILVDSDAPVGDIVRVKHNRTVYEGDVVERRDDGILVDIEDIDNVRNGLDDMNVPEVRTLDEDDVENVVATIVRKRVDNTNVSLPDSDEFQRFVEDELVQPEVKVESTEEADIVIVDDGSIQLTDEVIREADEKMYDLDTREIEVENWTCDGTLKANGD